MAMLHPPVRIDDCERDLVVMVRNKVEQNQTPDVLQIIIGRRGLADSPMRLIHGAIAAGGVEPVLDQAGRRAA